MRLKRVTIRNFKNLSNVTVDLHPHVTALIGKNNAGKSSVLHALDILLRFFGERPGIAWRTLHEMVVTGRHVDLTTEIEADIDLGGGDGGSGFGENLSSLISEGKVTPFLYLKMGGSLEQGIGFRAGDQSKQFDAQPTGSFSSGIDDLLDSAGLDGIGQINVNMAPIAAALATPTFLSADRSSPGRQSLRGAEQLDVDASNLLEFLITLLSEDRQSYQSIVEGLRSIIPEVMDVATPLISEGRQVDGLISDAAHPEARIDWGQVSSGTKHILQILAFATRAPVLLIEEPELSLHSDATVRLMHILQAICSASARQLICSTHSPALIDALGFDQVRVVVRQSDGPTEVRDMRGFEPIEGKMRKFGLSLGPLLASSGPSHAYPKFLLILEGRDDRLVWPKMLEHGGVEDLAVRIINGQGWPDACDITRVVGFLRQIGVHSLDYLCVLDSDGDVARRSEEVRSRGLSDPEFVVLKEKELESYLLDEAALARITAREVDDVVQVIEGTKGGGKERLQRVLERLGITSMDPGIMQAIVQQMAELPQELAAVVERVKESVSAAGE